MAKFRPVPMSPSHRPVWHRMRRYCTCGLIWRTCPDRYVRPAPYPPPVPPWATAVTAPNPAVLVGRGPLGMTPGQEMRSRGRR